MLSVLCTVITMGNHAVIYPFLNNKIAIFVIFKYPVVIVHRMVHNVENWEFQFTIHVVTVQEVLVAFVEFRKTLIFTFCKILSTYL